MSPNQASDHTVFLIMGLWVTGVTLVSIAVLLCNLSSSERLKKIQDRLLGVAIFLLYLPILTGGIALGIALIVKGLR